MIVIADFGGHSSLILRRKTRVLVNGRFLCRTSVGKYAGTTVVLGVELTTFVVLIYGDGLLENICAVAGLRTFCVVTNRVCL
jgi:hypothetical protein